MNLRAQLAAAFLGIAAPFLTHASSHREAPAIGALPRVDGTDLYVFRSYELGRAAYVTFIANYIPFQDPQGGPNFYPLDTRGFYDINIDNDGDGIPDISFQFHFNSAVKNFTVPSGGRAVPIPLINIGPVDKDGKTLNVQQSYTVAVWHGNTHDAATDATTGRSQFWKPVDNIGEKSIPDYAAYAANFVYDIHIPQCALPGRVFVGQRKEGFFINIGEVFDLVNTNPVGPRDAKGNDLSHKNITSIALEVPISCLTKGKDPVIGVYTTAALPDPSGHGNLGTFNRVSRLGNPLVNELVIGLPDKDSFNSSFPRDDARFLTYVTNPTLPVLLNTLFQDAAKIPGTPRNDLVAAYLTGVKGLNQPLRVKPAELLRLNTSIAPTAPASQNDLGVLAGDKAGFPNGRRPYDDVVDISLRVVEGALCGQIGTCGSDTTDPNKGAPYTDGARAAGPDASFARVTGAVNPADVYLDAFPYLNTPLPGSPQGAAAQ
jgi:hypothetical protein